VCRGNLQPRFAITELVVDENGGVTYLSPYTLSGRVATGGVLSPEIKKLLMQQSFFGR
jgi:hypothetical protein